MGTICRIYEQTDRGMKVIAQIRNGRVTGKKAGAIRKALRQYGFPHAPLEDVSDLVLMTTPGLGVAFVPTGEKIPLFSAARSNQESRLGGWMRLFLFWKRPREKFK